MGNARRDFFFRNRRWLLVFLFVIASFFLPSSNLSTAERIARFLLRATGWLGLEMWERVCYGLAALLVGLGAFWRTWGSAYLGTNVVQGRQLHTERLVADGPYRRTRNPLYFGNVVMALGLAILVNPAAGAIFVIGMWILVRLFIRDEESGLEETLGETYRAYRAAVPRLVPAWRAQVPTADAQPRWLQGFCGESFLWVFAMLTSWLAVTLDFHEYGKSLLGGAIISVPLFLWAKRHTRHAGPASP